MFIVVTKCGRGTTDLIPEVPAKITEIGKTAITADGTDGKIGGEKHLFRRCYSTEHTVSSDTIAGNQRGECPVLGIYAGSAF